MGAEGARDLLHRDAAGRRAGGQAVVVTDGGWIGHVGRSGRANRSGVRCLGCLNVRYAGPPAICWEMDVYLHSADEVKRFFWRFRRPAHRPGRALAAAPEGEVSVQPDNMSGPGGVGTPPGLASPNKED